MRRNEERNLKNSNFQKEISKMFSKSLDKRVYSLIHAALSVALLILRSSRCTFTRIAYTRLHSLALNSSGISRSSAIADSYQPADYDSRVTSDA
jgi:hypothetical protein